MRSKSDTGNTRTQNQHSFSWTLIGYVIAVLLLSVAYTIAVLADSAPAIPAVWGLIGFTCLGAMVLGIATWRPSARLPWILLAFGAFTFICADLMVKIQHYLFDTPNPFPSYADILNVLSYILFSAGIFTLLRKRAPKRTDNGSLLDALTIATSSALFVWVYLLLPNINPTASLFSQAVTILYPLSDVLIWAILIRLLLADSRTWSVQLLAIGALGLISSDVLYGLGQFLGIWEEGNPVDIGWVVFYTAWGLAFLHPSMRAMTQPLDHPPAIIRMRRLAGLAVAALVAPVVLVVESIRGISNTVAMGIALFAAILFLLVVLRMVTLSRQINQREAESKLNREKNELLAITSHQLRTPLTTIKLYSEALVSGKIQDPAQVQTYIKRISSSNERMIRIVNTLIYASELDMGEVKFHNEPVDISKAVKEAIDDNDALIQTKNATLHVDIPAYLPQALTDKTTLPAIIGSIVNNAVLYGADQNATITISAASDTETGTIQLTIADNGHGIPLADQEKVFTKLFRASNARRFSPDGSGLSLFLAREILDEIGGSITLASQENTGTRVTITLPIAHTTY